DSSLRNAMCRKDHGEFRAQFARGIFPSSSQLFRESLDEKRVVMPGVDKFKPERKPIAEGSPVQAYTGPRILRSKADHDRSWHLIRLHACHYVGNVRFPISHTDVHGRAQFAREQFSLFQSQGG